MNKKFIYAALASLAMVGCAKTEGVKPAKHAETIAFRPTNTSATRAETALQNLNSFVSVGIQNCGTTDASVYFTLKMSKPNSGDWDTQKPWTDNNFQSFNIGPALQDGFISKEKTNAVQKSSEAASGSQDALFTVIANSDNAGQPKATYSQKKGVNDNRDLDKGVDVVIGTTQKTNLAGSISGTGVLALNFKHIYSQILIKAKNEKANQYTVKVLGAAIAYVNSEGTFNFPLDETTSAFTLKPTSSTSGAAWTDLNTSVVYGNAWNKTEITKTGNDGGAATHDATTLTGTAQDVLHYTGDPETQGFYIIPQKVTSYKGKVGEVGTGTYLKVFVQISTVANENGAATQLFPKTVGKFGSVMVPITEQQGTEFEYLPGHKYIYTINFFHSDNGGGLSDPNPADNGSPKGTKDSNKRTGGGDPTTTDGNGTNPDIMENPTDKKPGDPVLNSEIIKFRVTVDDWTTDNSSTIEINL